MKYKHIIFDFDGVLVESNEIRFEGFRSLFKNYPNSQVNQLVDFAKANGGVSRYEKIKYFFNVVRNESLSNKEVSELASQFSRLVKQKVIDAKPVPGSIKFLSDHLSDFDFSIVSGSDEKELREVCKHRGLHSSFKQILGSPTPKEENIATLLKHFQWEKKSTVYIGDSNNDYDAAKINGISFIGRCSGLVDWEHMNVKYITDLSSLAPLLFSL